MHWASFGLVQRLPAALPVGMLWGDVLGPISSRADAQCQRMIEVQINDKLARGAHASQPSDSDVLHGTTAAGSASKLSKRKTSLMNTVQHVFCSAGSFWTRSRDIQLSLVGEERHLKDASSLFCQNLDANKLTGLGWLYYSLYFSEQACVQWCLTLCEPMDCSPPGSSVHEILQARILEWVAIPFSRGSSRPRDQNHISYVSFIGR